jgi:hypothetical protein
MSDGVRPQVRLRISLGQRLANLLDRLGNSAATDPRRQPQSVCGSITTVLFSTVAVYMFVVTLMKYVAHERGEIVGGRAQLNGLYQNRDGAAGSRQNQTWSDFHIPSLELKITSKLMFFHKEGERPAIFKVQARDRTGYLHMRQSDERETPVSFAVYSKHRVPIGSFDQRVNSKARSRGAGVKANLRDRIFYSSTVCADAQRAVLSPAAPAAPRTAPAADARAGRSGVPRAWRCSAQSTTARLTRLAPSPSPASLLAPPPHPLRPPTHPRAAPRCSLCRERPSPLPPHVAPKADGSAAAPARARAGARSVPGAHGAAAGAV